ncbi:MAG: hypothetical protein HYV09_11415 [Deltaproteobacteria bacterium]|nr:hypothetical protein [Deltaproteobacteria bacterium]
MKIDRVARVRDLRAIEAEIRPIKRVLGATWTRPMNEEQRRLSWLRKRATELCMVLAFARGRLHVRGPSDERTRALHAEVFARYEEVPL